MLTKKESGRLDISSPPSESMKPLFVDISGCKKRKIADKRSLKYKKTMINHGFFGRKPWIPRP